MGEMLLLSDHIISSLAVIPRPTPNFARQDLSIDLHELQFSHSIALQSLLLALNHSTLPLKSVIPAHLDHSFHY